jgi:tetratricopeptide (TPR) repeat protein
MTPPCNSLRVNRGFSWNGHFLKRSGRVFFFHLALAFAIIWIVSPVPAADNSSGSAGSSSFPLPNESGPVAIIPEKMPVKNAGIDYSTGTNSSAYPALDQNTSDALVVPESAAEENKTLAYNLVDKGLDCYYSKNMACAFASFESAHRILPMDANILYVQAQALTFQGRYDEALQKIDAALVLDPENAALWEAKGTILKKMGRWLESELCFNRAGELDSSYEIPVNDRFPLNILIKYSSVLILVVGLSLLGSFFYFKEIRRH